MRPLRGFHARVARLRGLQVGSALLGRARRSRRDGRKQVPNRDRSQSRWDFPGKTNPAPGISTTTCSSIASGYTRSGGLSAWRGDADYYAAFAQYESALEYSARRSLSTVFKRVKDAVDRFGDPEGVGSPASQRSGPSDTLIRRSGCAICGPHREAALRGCTGTSLRCDQAPCCRACTREQSALPQVTQWHGRCRHHRDLRRMPSQ